MHWLLRWLREGDEAVASLPPHTLRLLLAEARHWGMGELVERCTGERRATPTPTVARTRTLTLTVTLQP